RVEGDASMHVEDALGSIREAAYVERAAGHGDWAGRGVAVHDEQSFRDIQRCSRAENEWIAVRPVEGAADEDGAGAGRGDRTDLGIAAEVEGRVPARRNRERDVERVRDPRDS